MGLFNLFKSKKKPSKVSVIDTQNATPQNSVEGNVLYCQQLKCPMPIVKISEAFRSMQEGDRLVVLATDPAFRADLDAWIRKTGNQLADFQDGEVKKATLVKS